MLAVFTLFIIQCVYMQASICLRQQCQLQILTNSHLALKTTYKRNALMLVLTSFRCYRFIAIIHSNLRETINIFFSFFFYIFAKANKKKILKIFILATVANFRDDKRFFFLLKATSDEFYVILKSICIYSLCQ